MKNCYITRFLDEPRGLYVVLLVLIRYDRALLKNVLV